MKSVPLPHRPTAGSLEVLESRIAPARLIVVGINDTASNQNDVNYDTPNFFVDTVHGNDLISQAVGGYSTGLGAHPVETFYILLNAGDTLQVVAGDVTSTRTDLISVAKGRVAAFFEDKNHDNEIQQGELVSMALTNNASVKVDGSVVGSVTSNLTNTNTLDLDSLVSSRQSIGLLRISGDVGGNVYAGGDIKNLTVGDVQGVYAGTAALDPAHNTYSFFPGLEGMGTVKTGHFTTFTSGATTTLPAPGQTGGSILNLTAKTVDFVTAGNGGFGGKGGLIKTVQIEENTRSFSLQAGNGGAADLASRRINGGAGGDIIGVYVSGFSDNTPHDLLSIHAGQGGDAPSGVGGRGGSINSAFIGSSLVNGKPFSSRNFVADNVSMQAGDGGDGRIGGAGGSVVSSRSSTFTQGDTAAHLLTQGLTDEIEIVAGDGGASTEAGTRVLRGGVGGSIVNMIVTNQANQPVPVIAANEETIRFQAGDGGTVAGARSIGSAGGNIVNSIVTGSNVVVSAGDGSDGSVGGRGGGLVGLRLDQIGSAFIHTFDANMGNGGVGSTGPAGAGGSLLNLTVIDGDFSLFSINSTGGNGGDSNGSRGGAGGSVSNVVILDSNNQLDQPTIDPLFGNLLINTGTGGDGKIAGGRGGALLNLRAEAVNMSAIVATGDGGDALVSGNGGAGGGMRTVRLFLDGNSVNGAVPEAVTGTVVSGRGGNGVLSGGAGGLVLGALVRAFDDAGVNAGIPPVKGGDAAIIGGDGGNGGTGAAGPGGTIVVSGVYSQQGSGLLQGGDAGSGLRPAAGGSILGNSETALSGVYASKDVVLLGGHGGGGGAGGTLRYIGYGSAAALLTPVPTGDILIFAGDGDAIHPVAGRDFAGAGGSIVGLFGSVSSGLGSVTKIKAGDGGYITDGTRTGAGGSIIGATVERGPGAGLDGGTLTFEAGIAGGAGLAAADVKTVLGAKGGSISTVQVLGNIGQGTILRHFVAGDGGAGTSRGGAGGSVTNVQVQGHDIGVRSGLPYGVDDMGGIFAGIGGKGSQTDGIAGSVTTISADSIAAIVAGTAPVPELATTVANIKLNSTRSLEQALGTTKNDLFQLTYHPNLVQSDVVQGDAGTNEEQTFARIPGGSLSGVQPNGGPSTFTLSYKGETTRVLDADASPDDIQDALNELNTIKNDGMVQVLPGADDAHFVVVFNTPGDRPNITGVGNESTQPIVGDPRVGQVRDILNQLSAVNDPANGYPGFPGANVFSSTSESFRIVYRQNGADFGSVTGERLLMDLVSETQSGTLTQSSVQHVQLLGTGEFQIALTTPTPLGDVTIRTAPLNVNATHQQVEDALNDAFTAAGFSTVTVADGATPHSYDISFADPGERELFMVREFATFASTTPSLGSATTPEIQSLNFSPLHGVNDLVFMVPGVANPVVVPAHTDISEPPSALDVQNALSAVVAGGVTVTQSADNTFNISPNTAASAAIVDGISAYEALPTRVTSLVTASTITSAATTPTQGNATTLETQLIQINPADGTFTITFNGATTAPLSGPLGVGGAATADQVEDALNALATVGANGVDVAKTIVAGGQINYEITFTTPGDRTDLTFAQTFNQVQRLAVANLGTFMIAGSDDILSSHSSEEQVQAALAEAGQTATVTRVDSEPGTFLIEYPDGQPHPLPVVTDKLPLTSTLVGTINQLSYARQITFAPDQYATANLVGAIAHYNLLGADHFSYVDVNNDGVFNLATATTTGDIPLDGLIAARNFSQTTSNFTPQARIIINTDAITNKPGQYRPVDPANPNRPVFYDFFNDQLV